ncbi:hypothetical protein LUZ62_085110 [Rhynchospora pubera]|uniref:C2H2-type domain-containing protein n=1 Tax=Rhynchospora pubera TaxID=906938 RepID=A0AAV8C6B8_9POAL|nr:hypothetical protein LUZ62_085110 [Rhynchospora pubera]
MELPTITFQEALKKEEEYKKKIRTTRPQSIFGPNLHQPPIKETTSSERRPPFCINAESAAQRFPLQSQPQTSAIQRPLQSTSPVLPPRPPTAAVQSTTNPNQQQRNWPPNKPRPPPQHKLPPYVQISKPPPPMSYWCKLCKIDCTTEYNFRAHIGGKRHQAVKFSILDGRSNARGESSRNHNRRNTNQTWNQNENENRDAECYVRQEGETSGLASTSEFESSVNSAGASNNLEGLIDLTTDE